MSFGFRLVCTLINSPDYDQPQVFRIHLLVGFIKYTVKNWRGQKILIEISHNEFTRIIRSVSLISCKRRKIYMNNSSAFWTMTTTTVTYQRHKKDQFIIILTFLFFFRCVFHILFRPCDWFYGQGHRKAQINTQNHLHWVIKPTFSSLVLFAVSLGHTCIGSPLILCVCLCCCCFFGHLLQFISWDDWFVPKRHIEQISENEIMTVYEVLSDFFGCFPLFFSIIFFGF